VPIQRGTTPEIPTMNGERPDAEWGDGGVWGGKCQPSRGMDERRKTCNTHATPSNNTNPSIRGPPFLGAE